jgi:hypothetical protein
VVAENRCRRSKGTQQAASLKINLGQLAGRLLLVGCLLGLQVGLLLHKLLLLQFLGCLCCHTSTDGDTGCCGSRGVGLAHADTLLDDAQSVGAGPESVARQVLFMAVVAVEALPRQRGAVRPLGQPERAAIAV